MKRKLYVFSMEALSMCRICLVKDVRMHNIVDTNLQDMYEKLTLLPFYNGDERPLQVCYMCCARLRNCCYLQTSCLQSEELFNQMLTDMKIQPKRIQDVNTFKIVHPMIYLNCVPVAREHPVDDGLNMDPLSVIYNVRVKEEHIEDAQDHTIDHSINTQNTGSEISCYFKDEDTSLEDDYQFDRDAEYNDAFESTEHSTENNREPDDIIETTETQNDIQSDYRTPLILNRDICQKTVKIVLNRVDLNDIKTSNTGDIKSGLAEKGTRQSITSGKPETEDKHFAHEVRTIITPGNTGDNKSRLAEKGTRQSITPGKPETEVKDKHFAHEVRTITTPGTEEKQSNDASIDLCKCDVCGKWFRHKQYLRKHIRYVHLGLKPHICYVCNKTFSCKATLNSHRYIHRGEKIYKCDSCDKYFYTKYNLTIHRRGIHTDEFKCFVCGKCFTRKLSLQNHINIHTGEKPYQCKLCDKRFRTKPDLKRHDIFKHIGEKTYKCDICKKSFFTRKAVRSHALLHTDKKVYECDICKKRFKIKGQLLSHILVHLKPHKCSDCEKCFVSKTALEMHSRVHTGEKPFQCNICSKWFCRKDVLNKHFRIHSGEKPYKCGVCGKYFRLHGSLNVHSRIHTGVRPYKCDICDKRFIENSRLIMHRRIHTGEKPFVCEICGKCFNQKSSLNTHSRIHNGKKKK